MEKMRHGGRAILAVLILMVTVGAWAAPVDRAPPALEEILIETGVGNDLRQLLGMHYRSFGRNFEEVANPVLLKDGGVFIDGWRTGDPGSHAAAFVYYSDGRLYAAYYDSDLGSVVYFGEKGGIHPALQVWKRRFGPPVRVIEIAYGPRASGEVLPKANAIASGTPSIEEQEQLRLVAASVWSGYLADGWNMNSEVGDILGTVTKEIMDCSAAFSLIPKPVGWVPGWSYVAKNALQITNYISGVSGNNQYKVCVNAAALNWRSAIEMASAGI